MKIAAIVPCYNEEASVKQVVEELNAFGSASAHELQVVVVNDCSTDQTATIARGLDCALLDLPVNLGIGGAMHCGYKYAFNEGFDVAIQVDGDGQHIASEITKLLAPLEQGEADVVIGSRFLTGEGFQSTFMRRLGIRYFQRLNKMIVGVQVSDSTSGFRAFNRTALAVVNDYYPDEYPEAEAVVLFALNQQRMLEVPVEMRARQGGQSSISGVKSIYYLFKVTLAIIFTYLRLKGHGKRHSV